MKTKEKFFKKTDSENKVVSRVSFKIPELIARRIKPDRNYIKDAIAIFCTNVCPEKETALKNVSLSKYTVTRRIEEISTHIQSEISKLCDKLEFCSLAIDENTGISDTAQLTVFI